MELETIQNIIRRAAQEPDFRAVLFSRPAEALAGYDLSAAAAAQLSALTPEAFDALSGELDTRASMSVIWGTEVGPRPQPKIPGGEPPIGPLDATGYAIGG